jgi:hypothetical protein
VGAAACVIVNVCPATEITPIRSLPVFSATTYCTVPSPVPDPPETIVTHATWLVALHEHPEDVDTTIGAPLPPAAAIDSLRGAIVAAHDGVPA